MRVTNSMLVNGFMNNLNTNMTKLSKLANQLASGRKYANISDDPAALIYSQAAKNKLHRLSHYKRTLETAQDWLVQSEKGLSDLNEVVKAAYEACVQASTDVNHESDKSNIASYIRELRDQYVDTLNTAFGEKYVFGGYNTVGDPGAGGVSANTNAGPFTVREVQEDPLDPDSVKLHLFYNDYDLTENGKPPSGMLGIDNLSFEVAPGVNMEVSVNGIDLAVVGGLNTFDLLNQLYEAANSGAAAEELGKFIQPLQDAQNHLLKKSAELGGRTNRLELLSARYEQDEINYVKMKSDAEDADYAEVIMNQKMAESVYNAALASGAKIIQPTLMDFLR